MAGRIWKGLVFLWKLFLGMLFCRGPVLSLLVVGWTYRLMQRSVVKRWWLESRRNSEGEDFQSFLREDEATEAHRGWPNWVLQQNFREAIRRRPALGMVGYFKGVCRAFVGSLWLNLSIGFKGVVNSWIVTLPGCVVMVFSWYAGWNNSFNKGYEQAAVGPATGFLGILLFIVAMLYVPLAQVRQAVTNRFRSFYDYRLIVSIIRRRWLACLGLAALYPAFLLPISLAKILPMYFPNINPAIIDLSNEQMLEVLDAYYFWTALLVFPSFVFLCLAACRIYVRGLLTNFREGIVSIESLSFLERNVLERMQLLEQRPRMRHHPIVIAASRTGGLFLRWAGILTTMILWFTLVAQVYIAQFFNYVPIQGWLNFPLIHLPWIRFIPEVLR